MDLTLLAVETQHPLPKSQIRLKQPFQRWMTLLAVHVSLLAVDVVTFWRWMCFLAVDVLFGGGS